MEPSPTFGPTDFEGILSRLREATLDRYQIYSTIGRGGMALVVAALDLSLGRKVAIKILLDHDSAPDAAERFDREARLAASLSHPNIVPIYSIEHYDDLRFFVMKYVEGQSFDAALRRDGAQSPELVQIILEDIGSALDHAHARGVVHRDLKPANIMLDQGGWAILMDFGIAKAEEYAALTHTGFMVGTPAYLPPEYFSHGTYGPRADQYAMGIVLFELLANRKPFMGKSPAALMKSHLFDQPPDLASLRTDCPPELLEVIGRMLEKNPDDRFASFKEAAAALKPLPADSQVSARIHMKDLAARGAERQPKIEEPVGPATPRNTVRPKSGAMAAVSVTKEEPQQVATGTYDVAAIFARGNWYKTSLWALIGATVVFTVLWIRQPTKSQSANKRDTTSVVDAAHVIAAQSNPPPTASSVTQTPSTAVGARTNPNSTRANTVGGSSSRLAAKSPSAAVAETLTAVPVTELPPPIPVVEPPPPTLPPAKGWVKIGSRKPTAVLYVNGELQSLLSGIEPRVFPVDPGTVALEIRADGCGTPWKQNVKVKSGDTVNLRWRSPTACDSIPYP